MLWLAQGNFTHLILLLGIIIILIMLTFFNKLKHFCEMSLGPCSKALGFNLSDRSVHNHCAYWQCSFQRRVPPPYTNPPLVTLVLLTPRFFPPPPPPPPPPFPCPVVFPGMEVFFGPTRLSWPLLLTPLEAIASYSPELTSRGLYILDTRTCRAWY